MVAAVCVVTAFAVVSDVLEASLDESLLLQAVSSAAVNITARIFFIGVTLFGGL